MKTSAQRFLYVTDGSVHLHASGKDHLLGPRGYAYLPQGVAHRITSRGKSRAILIEKAYIQHAVSANASDVDCQQRRQHSFHAAGGRPGASGEMHLLPDTLAFDFAVNIMVYQPGASLSQVEMHIMEHGLMMLEGGGIYRLGDAWYPVTAGDFIWMGPWCPQWFGAIGKVPAKYIIYKDWNRHPLAGHATVNLVDRSGPDCSRRSRSCPAFRNPILPR